MAGRRTQATALSPTGSASSPCGQIHFSYQTTGSCQNVSTRTVKLPNAHLAIVDPRKVVEYLLNPAHPRNGGKARFFAALGFSADASVRFIDALRSLAVTGDAVARVESVHGEKYVVDGLLSGHTEKSQPRMVRTVWMTERGQDVPRLVTAYPREG